MTNQTLQVISLSIGLLAYFSLVVVCAVAWKRKITGKALFLASSLTLLFILTMAITGESAYSFSAEVLALSAWIALILRAIGLSMNNYRSPEYRSVSILGVSTATLTVFALFYVWTLADAAFVTQNFPISILFIIEILICVTGLVAIEQLARNTLEDLRWRLRFLNIGLGMIFTFGILHNAATLIQSVHIPLLSDLQPVVLAFAVPFIAITSYRNRDNQLRLNVSRQFVFRSGILITTSIGLMLIAMSGYYLQLGGSNMAIAAAILTTTLLILAVFVVLGSNRFRIQIRRMISNHIFNSKHDYRERWARVTSQLTEPDPDFTLSQQAIRALAAVFDATGGALWRLKGDSFIHESELHVSWAVPLNPQTSSILISYFQDNRSALDLESLDVSAQPTINLFEDLKSLPNIRFLIPLFVDQQLIGLVGIHNPPTPFFITLEDEDILKLISHEVAGFLALRFADQELSESRQFDAMNRVSAFLVHDVKTISTQLLLLTENAQRHKTNPVFIEDMLLTVENAVTRMQNLLVQLQQERDETTEHVKLGELLPGLIDEFKCSQPAPVLNTYNPDATVHSNRDRLASAIRHTLQNAVDATPKDGRICVTTVVASPWLELVIMDTGSGMSDKFIAEKLFAPFESTKGVAGMGIGVYQVREFVRSLGGDLVVSSAPGHGSSFTLKIPLTIQASR